MNRSILLVALVFSSAANVAPDDPVEALKKGRPAPVAALIDRIVGCNHWASSPPSPTSGQPVPHQ
jgi:hypothetical protein